MVRVVPVYHLREQGVQTISEHINAACLVAPNKIALATASLDVEIRDLHYLSTRHEPANADVCSEQPSEHPHCYSFPVVDEIEQMIYCRNGNYIATIESKQGNINEKKSYVRIYSNWNCIDPSSDIIAILRARIAGKVTPSDKYLNSQDLEMIELPISNLVQPHIIACCQVTGNIAISSNNKIYFFQFKLCKTETGRHEYIDFEEIPFFVELAFMPIKLEINEGIIGCMDHYFMNLFKITLVFEQSIISAETSEGSLSSDFSTSIKVNTKDTLDFQKIRTHSSLNKEKFRVNVISDSEKNYLIMRDGSVEARPERVNDMLIILRSYDNSDALSKYTIRSLLQLKIIPPIKYHNSLQEPIYDCFKCFAMRPLYVRKAVGSSKRVDNFFASNYSKNLLSVAIAVTTQQDGYLYHFYNNDEWRQDSEVLASYSFTSPVIDITLGESVLHALTESGIETYTLRIGQKIFYFPCEYFLNYSASIDIGPTINDPICLIGMHPFKGTQHFFSTDENFVILSTAVATEDSLKFNNDFSKSTITNLKIPEAEDVYEKIEEFAFQHKKENPKVFLHLMWEAHVMIRMCSELAKVRAHCEQQDQLDENSKIVILMQLTEHVHPVIENILFESCRKLADYFVMQRNEEEYYLALPYYVMGNLCANEIFNRVLKFEGQGVESMNGIIYTLKQLFLRLQPDSDELNQLLNEGNKNTELKMSLSHLSNKNNINEIVSDVQIAKAGNFMKIFFELLMKYSPAEITTIALQSHIFLERMGDQIYEFLEKRCEKTHAEQLCVALQLVRKKKSSLARDLIETIDTTNLLNMLMKHWPVLFETSMNHKNGHSIVIFSEFTEQCLLTSKSDVVQTVTANVLKYLLVNLQVLPFEVLLKMLIDYSSLQIGYEGGVIGKKILLATLELYLLDYASHKRCKQEDSPSDNTTFSISNTRMDLSNKESIIKQSVSSVSSPVLSSSSSSTISEADTALSIFGITATSKALRILVRFYLGQLQEYSLVHEAFESNNINKNPTTKCNGNARSEFDIVENDIDLIFEHHSKLNQYSDFDILRHYCFEGEGLQDRSILFLERRYNYLNMMPPLEANFLDILERPKYHFLKIMTENCNKKLNTVCIKLQSLLCSEDMPHDIVNEISQFVFSNSSVIGIESIISCLLPVRECIEFLVNVCPQCVLEYAKNRITQDSEWAYLINCLQVKTNMTGDATELNGGLLLFYHRLLKEILEHIANTKPLETVLKIFPEEDITTTSMSPRNIMKKNRNKSKNELIYETHYPNDHNTFIQYLRISVEKERTRKLKQVITVKSGNYKEKL